MFRHIILRNPDSCINRADVDEPIFVLRAKDPCAAFVVRCWCFVARFFHESPKVSDAHRIADAMTTWREDCVVKGRTYTTPGIEFMQDARPDVALKLIPEIMRRHT